MTAYATDGEMRIGDLARQVGVNAKTIRYYEQLGLLPEPRRRPSGYRVYGPEDLERLNFIRLAQRFGLRLDAIGEILALRDRGERPCRYVLAEVRREVDDLDRRIGELQSVRAQLSHLLNRAETLPASDAARYCELLEHSQNEDE